jgi:hypothetical protein
MASDNRARIITSVINFQRSSSVTKQYLPQYLPLFIQHGNCCVCRKIKLARHYGYIVIGNCPFIVVFAFIKVYKVACHPKITSSIRIKSLYKFFYPFGISLSANPYAFIVSLRFGGIFTFNATPFCKPLSNTCLVMRFTISGVCEKSAL